MPWTIETADEGRVLKITYTGTFSADDARVATNEILTAMLERKITRVMLDCVEAHMEVPIVNIYQLPDIYEARGIPRRTRAAVLLPKDKHHLELYAFYEDVCVNRGYFVKLFEDSAAAW